MIRTKNIICVESWEGFETEPMITTMKPLLDFISLTAGIKYNYSFIRTPHEMKYVIENVPVKKYSLLYIAVHGDAGQIKIGASTEFKINLDELSEMMGERFAGYGVHFASCGTMNGWEESLLEFKRKTKVSFISGYTKYVDFQLSSVVDHAFINEWLRTYSSKTLFKRLRERCKRLLEDNGFEFII